MDGPYMSIYVKNDTLFFSKKLPSEDRSREILELSIDEVTSYEFDEASKKLGNTVLGILRLWHKDVFHSWGKGSGADNCEEQVPNEFDIAMHLISKSVSIKTNTYVQSIEALLCEQSLRTKAAHEFYEKSWPDIRARLEKFV